MRRNSTRADRGILNHKATCVGLPGLVQWVIVYMGSLVPSQVSQVNRRKR